MRLPVPLLVLAAASAVATACTDSNAAGKVALSASAAPAGAPMGREAGDPIPEGLTPSAVAMLDSAGAAFRGRDYPRAEALYRRAAREVPEQPAPWFGVFLVAQATRNTALADSARTEVSRRPGGAELLTAMGAAGHTADSASPPP